MVLIKATNNAIALELKRVSTTQGIVFIGHFEGDTEVTRIVPKILLWEAFVRTAQTTFADFVWYLYKHDKKMEELSRLCELIKEQKAEVKIEDFTIEEIPCRLLSYDISEEKIGIQVYEKEVKVFFEPPTDGRDLITVDKEEFLGIIKKALE